MSECNEHVPNLIGKLRETRQTNSGVVLPKGYRTKELIGKKASDSWKNQLRVNNSIIQVLNENKLHEEVEQILEQQRKATNLEADNVDDSKE